MNTQKHTHLPDSSRVMRQQRMVAVGHYLTALVLAFKAVTYMGHDPVPWPFVSLCLVSATVVAAVTLMHHRLESRFPDSQVLIYLAEAVVCAVLAYHTHEEGKVGLPYAWALAASILFVRAGWLLFRGLRRSGTEGA
jgi:hypothetical protein